MMCINRLWLFISLTYNTTRLIIYIFQGRWACWCCSHCSYSVQWVLSGTATAAPSPVSPILWLPLPTDMDWLLPTPALMIIRIILRWSGGAELMWWWHQHCLINRHFDDFFLILIVTINVIWYLLLNTEDWVNDKFNNNVKYFWKLLNHFFVAMKLKNNKHIEMITKYYDVTKEVLLYILCVTTLLLWQIKWQWQHADSAGYVKTSHFNDDNLRTQGGKKVFQYSELNFVLLYKR